MEFAADYFKICGKCGALLFISSIDFKSIVFKLNLKVENFIFFYFLFSCSLVVRRYSDI